MSSASSEAEAGPFDVVAFAPHPDDAELGCGGLLASASRAGRRTAIVDLTAGEMASRGSAALRSQECASATAVLGVSHRECLGLPDAAVDGSEPQVLAVVAAIRRLRPRLALVPVPDRHPDHRATNELVLRALGLANIGKVGEGSPHRCALTLQYLIHGTMVPTLVLDTSSSWPVQRDAIAAYRSQFGAAEDVAHPRTALSGGDFLRAHEARTVHFGSLIGVRHGEPYLSVGPLPVADVAMLSALASVSDR